VASAYWISAVPDECNDVQQKIEAIKREDYFFKNRLPVARGALRLPCPMRTGRLAGVATNKTVCSRRIRRHFFSRNQFR
jgi:hypothetical protein